MANIGTKIDWKKKTLTCTDENKQVKVYSLVEVKQKSSVEKQTTLFLISFLLILLCATLVAIFQ